jgi:hypothetical protein
MENPQAQMQGQGQPQAQGQDQQMQQVMQVVQQMVQQGMQPVEIAAQLLQQVPPEAIMQVFVQMGIPQEEAQASIQEAMQQGQQAQQPQGPGEEQMEGAASNQVEEVAESEETQMMYGGGLPRRLVKRAEGGGNPEQEMQAVMGQVQQMMQGGADARQVMEQIQAAAQQGQISPEVAQAVMEQLSGQMQAVDPQAPQEGQNPQNMDPNMASPDSQMMMFGGNFKKLMSKALGGDLTPPSVDSKTYAQDRAATITNAIKNNTFKSTLNSDFPSLMGNQMMYGGDLPKADIGADIKNAKTKDEAELAAYRYRQTLSPEEQAKFSIEETLKTWKAPEPTYEAGKSYEFDPTTKQFKVKEAPAPTYEAGKNYQYDPATKGFKAVDTPAAPGQFAQGVGYPNPFGGGLAGNLYYGASPMARFMANSYGYGMPQVRGKNLPGGMDATAFMMQTAGKNLAPGFAGQANGQDYRVTGVEDIKGGLFGRKKVGVRYNIDWGSPEAMAAQQQGSPAGPGFSGFNADANGDNIPDYLGASTTDMNKGTSAPAGPQNQPADLPAPKNSAGQNYLDSTYGDIRTDLSADGQQALDQLIASGADQNQIDEGVTALLNSRNAALLEDEKAAARNAIINGVNPQTIPSFTEQSTEQFDPATQEQMSKLGETMNKGPELSADIMKRRGGYEIRPDNAPYSSLQERIKAESEEDYKKLTYSPRVGGVNDGNPDNVQAIKSQSLIGANFNNPSLNAPTLNNPTGEGYRYNQEEITKRQEAADFQNSQAAKGLVWNAATNSWVPQAALDASTQINAAKNTPTPPKVEYDTEAIAGPNFATQQDLMNIVNNPAPPYRAYGGSVDPQALNNAVQLINKAFGGMMPMARNGMEMQSSIDVKNKNKFNPDWDAVSDMYMNTGSRLVNFMDGVNAINPERDTARMSALNTQPMEFSQMKQGLYDQAGNFIPNDIGNQVLNPTDVYYNQEKQIFAYGGRVYEIGGDVELDDNEVMALQQAGFKIAKM